MRWTMLIWTAAFAGALLGSGCLRLLPGADGEACTDSADCRSGTCNEGYCAGSDCADDPDVCREGWACVHHSPGAIGSFFGASGSDTCVATCGHCPGNTYCPKEGVRGQTRCAYGKAPLDLSLPSSTAVVGQETKLVAVALDGAVLVSCRWNLGDAVTTRGGVVSHRFREARETGVSVECTDADDRVGRAEGTVLVTCQARGAACDPSLCCEGRFANGCLPGASATGSVCRDPVLPTVSIHGPAEVVEDTSVQYAVTIAGDGQVSAVSWEFSDASFNDRGESVSHTFREPGEHRISATVTDEFGGQGTASMQVTVR